MSSGSPSTCHRVMPMQTPMSAELVLIRMSGLVSLLSETLARWREAEAKRGESGDRFRSLVQNSSDVITVTDGVGTIVYQSPSVEGVLGYGPEELLGRRLEELVHPEDADSVATVCHSLAESSGRDRARIEFRWQHRDGGWVAIGATIANSLDDPSVQGLVLNARDVTARKELAAQLAHQAFHVRSPTSPIAACSASGSSTRLPGARRSRSASPCSSSMSTTSRRSTTASATRWAMSYCSTSPTAFARACVT